MVLALPLLTLVLATPGAPVPYPGLSALIDRVGVQLEAQVKNTQAGLREVRVRKEELDSDGKVEHVTEESLRAQGEGASQELVLVHATEDGKDVTAKKLAERAEWLAKKGKGDPKKDAAGEGHHEGVAVTDVNPFARSVRAKYRYWVVGPLPPAGQPIRLHFEPNVEPTRELFVGDALVDPKTASIRSVRFAPSDLPPLVDLIKVKAVMGSDGAAPAAKELEVEGKGGLLFWHKHFRVHLWFGATQS
jgi:hypothetical protein